MPSTAGIAELRRENAHLADRLGTVAEHLDTVATAYETLKADYTALKDHLDWFKRQLFGRHSEKRLEYDPTEQASLFEQLAVALGIAAVKARKSVYRTTLAELVEALAKARREDRLTEKIRFFTRTSLLIVDEIGYVAIDGGGANLFFQLVNARYEKGAMILTSNRGFAEWGELFGDPVVATALLDRLLHHAIVIQIEGASYRLREHTDLIPEHVRANAPIAPPPPPKRRGRPLGNKEHNTDARR